MAYVVVSANDFALIRGEPRCFESSTRGRRCFCPECGSALLFKSSRMPERQIVAAASLDSFIEFAPDADIWTESAVTWLHAVSPGPPA